ncbi:MAG: phosphoribosylamine--glycine ligase [Spirochaetes bacterium]|nr:phosphoribosylamine--glycine ligase [Spirochaetota bacterium]
MNVLLLGSGGREHSIAKKISESKKLKKFYAIPGNPGINNLAENIDISLSDITGIINFAKESKIDLIICGPENPLVAGLTDEALKNNILVFGPKKEGAILEGSKIYAKKFMVKYNIPTADFRCFNSYNEAKKYFEKKVIFPVVIKADGLASGKGVVIVNNKADALETINKYMNKKIFQDAGERIVVEDCLIGEEMSFFYITDGKTFLPLIPAKDYKRALDNDMGENTGGMGSYAPHLSITEKLKKQIHEEIVINIKNGFRIENIDYRGILYIGLMLTDDGPKVIEFNCRFGDPETQVILPLIENDLLELMYSAALGKLESQHIKWKNDYAACVVIASGGYPAEFKNGLKIKFDIDPYEYIHAGTAFNKKQIVTNGGRVLNCVAIGPSKKTALENAYTLAKKVHFDNLYYRTDIGK